MTIAGNPHAAALLTRLATVTFGTPSAPLQVGDAVAPKSANGLIVAPAVVLYIREGGSLSGNLGVIDTDGEMPFQTTSIGRTAAEARVVDDKCCVALTGAQLVVPDRWIPWVRRRNGVGSQIQRDDDVTPPLFYVVTQYVLLTIAAS